MRRSGSGPAPTSPRRAAPTAARRGSIRIATAWYGAVFAENVFRLPGRWHVVPSVRIEHEKIRIDESVRPPNLVRPLIHQSASRTIPMFGLGAGFDFGRQNETYFSVSQGYRPVRFFDVASPFSNVSPGGVPDASKSLSWEAGVHGTPVTGLFYDASLFWIDFKNRIETIVISPTKSVLQNSGDTRHRGLRRRDVLRFSRAPADGLHLTAFGNVSLLDAKFTRATSPIASATGRPSRRRVTAKYGVTLRQDGRFNLSLTGSSVSSQYFQDSDLPVGTPSERELHPREGARGDAARSSRRLAADPQYPRARAESPTSPTANIITASSRTASSPARGVRSMRGSRSGCKP